MRLRAASGLCVAALAAACGGATGPDPVAPAPAPSVAPEPPPVLSVPMIDLGRVVRFIPFGATLDSGVVNPAYELVTARQDVEVRAVTAGTVARIGADPGQGDFELHVRPSAASDFLVIYDHVRELAVAEGAAVRAGDRLGVIGRFGPREGRVELQINRRGTPEVAVCPRDLGTAEFNAAHDAALAATRSGHAGVCLAATVLP